MATRDGRSARSRVLLVEGAPVGIRVLTRGARRAGQPCQLTIAINGEEALSLLEQAGTHAPELAVVHLTMPRASAPDFLDALRTRPWRAAGLPVIAYTTSDLPPGGERPSGHGVVDYLVRTAPVEEVLEVIRQILDLRPDGEEG